MSIAQQNPFRAIALKLVSVLLFVVMASLIKAASEKWHEHEGDYRDDITAIVIRLKDLWSK